MSPGMRAYRAMMCLYQRDASGFILDRALSGHLLQVTGTDETCTPQGAMQEHDCVQDEELQVLQGGRKHPRSFHKHGSHLQQTFPGEPNPRHSS